MSAILRVNADGRHSPRNNVPFNWGTSGTVWQNGGGTNPFSVTSTDPNGVANFGINQATGRSGPDGTVTIALTNGFTPPAVLTAWEWNPNIGSDGGYLRLGASASEYNESFDATYTSWTFKISENTYFLIQSDVVITGQVLTDATVDKIVGYQLEGGS